MKTLGPKTQALYARMIARAYGSRFPVLQVDLGTWTAGCLGILRAAVKFEASRLKLDPEPILVLVPQKEIKIKIPRVPNEDQSKIYESAAQQLPPGRRALALLPLLIGVRAEEFLRLERSQVQDALDSGELYLMRKGDKEHVLPVKKVKPLLVELLEAVAAPGRALDAKSRRWTRVGEILSSGAPNAQYKALHKLVRTTARAAGIKNGRPHLLRHAFASRMDRDGASMFTIKEALGHSNISTTQRYVHKSTKDVGAFMRRA